MQFRDWKNDNGTFSYAVEFKKGTGALRLKEFETLAECRKAQRKLKEYTGDNYEKHDFVWEVTNPNTGAIVPLFKRITFDQTISF